MAALLAAFWLILAARPAEAAGFPPGSTCYASGAADEKLDRVLATPARWNCGSQALSYRPARVFVRFDLPRTAGDPPGWFIGRATRFERITLTAIDPGGRQRHRSYDMDQVRLSNSDWTFAARLPVMDRQTSAVVATIDKAWATPLISRARLAAAPHDAEGPTGGLLFAAALCGLLFVPLVVNLAFWRVLREPFVLWHASAVLFMLMQTLALSGLLQRIHPVPLWPTSLIGIVSFGFGVAAATMFSAGFIEERSLDPRMRRALRWSAAWVVANTLLLAAGPPALRPWLIDASYASFLPVLLLIVAAMIQALRRDSRAVKFQIVAWTPVMIVGIIRMVTNAISPTGAVDAFFAQNVSLAIEVLITALGVADRMILVREQRDRAQSEARVLGDLAESDPLTGLMNRRAVEPRFEQLRRRGFRAMAVIDLDHFKSVNDTHGHSVGDRVLKVVAEALEPDEDTLALRMGGEEFLLLLRGTDIEDRAERRRRAITTRVAAQLPGLQRMVTASMGLVVHAERAGDAGRLSSDFTALYEHCDRLLYEAKRVGRNRTVMERLRSFSPAPAQRPARQRA
ncbi:diguanylate cyclase [Novosphingobium tardum]|uniref:diguanylate cyclase n=1 Tax=Novosphingobium tardum TaxID=1538021 RepID=A0ABV8RNI0_9SPHN